MLISVLLIVFIALVICGFQSAFTMTRGKKAADKTEKCGSLYNETVFLSKEFTDSLKGISTIMIVFSHLFQFGNYSSTVIGGEITGRVVGTWGALGVAIFLLLSGYGCWYSIQKCYSLRDRLLWLLKHVLRIAIFFVVAFIVVVLIRKLGYGYEDDWIDDLLHLRIPGSTTWYLKIQILMYMLLIIATFFPIKHRTLALLLLTLAYAIIAKILLLPDFWWKTAICFSTGAGLAQISEKMRIVIDKRPLWCVSISTVVVISSMILILIDKHYVLPIQLLSYAAIACGFSIFIRLLRFNSRLFAKLGKWSLSIYLVHIGLVGVSIMEGTDKELIYFITLIIVTVFFTEVLGKMIISRCRIN